MRVHDVDMAQWNTGPGPHTKISGWGTSFALDQSTRTISSAKSRSGFGSGRVAALAF